MEDGRVCNIYACRVSASALIVSMASHCPLLQVQTLSGSEWKLRDASVAVHTDFSCSGCRRPSVSSVWLSGILPTATDTPHDCIINQIQTDEKTRHSPPPAPFRHPGVLITLGGLRKKKEKPRLPRSKVSVFSELFSSSSFPFSPSKLYERSLSIVPFNDTELIANFSMTNRINQFLMQQALDLPSSLSSLPSLLPPARASSTQSARWHASAASCP
jgi:hypothetical protein